MVTESENLLAGTLFTSQGILHNILIRYKGSNYTLEPLVREIHSTAYSSRVALIDRALWQQSAHTTLHAGMTMEQLYIALQPLYATPPYTTDTTLILNLEQI